MYDELPTYEKIKKQPIKGLKTNPYTRRRMNRSYRRKVQEWIREGQKMKEGKEE